MNNFYQPGFGGGAFPGFGDLPGFGDQCAWWNPLCNNDDPLGGGGFDFFAPDFIEDTLGGLGGQAQGAIEDFLTGTLGLGDELATRVARALKTRGVQAAMNILDEAGLLLGGDDDQGGSRRDESGPVVLYEDENFGGDAISFGPGRYDTRDLVAYGLGNDRLTSLRVSKGYKVTLYIDEGFLGGSTVYNAKDGTINERSVEGIGWNDETSAVVIEKVSDDADNNFGDDDADDNQESEEAALSLPLILSMFGIAAGLILFTFSGAR